MRLYLIRVDNHLVPHGDESLAEFERLPFEKELQAEVTQPRNLQHHKLFFALCARIGAGIGKGTEWVERAFKVELGYWDNFRYGGQDKLVLRSISFAKMDQIAFREFFEACVETAYRVWKIDPASVADLLVPEESHRKSA